MEKPKYRSALIVGTGPGLSASLARLLATCPESSLQEPADNFGALSPAD